MNAQTRNKALAAILTVAFAGTLLVGGIGGYAVAKAEESGTALGASQTTVNSTIRASRWDHEELPVTGSTTPRASRWDHEER